MPLIKIRIHSEIYLFALSKFPIKQKLEPEVGPASAPDSARRAQRPALLWFGRTALTPETRHLKPDCAGPLKIVNSKELSGPGALSAPKPADENN